MQMDDMMDTYQKSDSCSQMSSLSLRTRVVARHCEGPLSLTVLVARTTLESGNPESDLRRHTFPGFRGGRYAT